MRKQTTLWLRSGGNAALCNTGHQQIPPNISSAWLGLHILLLVCISAAAEQPALSCHKMKAKPKTTEWIKDWTDKKKSVLNFFFLPEFSAEKRVRKSGRGRSFSLRVWFSPWIAKLLFLCWPLFPAGFSSWNGAYSRPGSWSFQDFREWLADGNLRPSCWYLRHRCLDLPLSVS